MTCGGCQGFQNEIGEDSQASTLDLFFFGRNNVHLILCHRLFMYGFLLAEKVSRLVKMLALILA
jgi:hypothetical protein